MFCIPNIICSALNFFFFFFFLILLFSLPLIPHLSLQPGCDPMTAPVPVPMLLFPHQVRWIYASFSSLGTVYTSAVIQKKAEKGTGNQKMSTFPCHFSFVTRPFDPTSASGGFRSREIFLLQEEMK